LVLAEKLDFGQVEQTNNIIVRPHLTKLSEKWAAMSIMGVVVPVFYP